jgi:hypothetical protein
MRNSSIKKKLLAVVFSNILFFGFFLCHLQVSSAIYPDPRFPSFQKPLRSYGQFSFNTSNQGWRMVGLYDGLWLDPVPLQGHFENRPAVWFDQPFYSSSGVIAVGGNGGMFPVSPSSNMWLHWDLNSPYLGNSLQWQGISSFTYEVSGEKMWVYRTKVYVQAYLRVKKGGTIMYITDGIAHEVQTTRTEVGGRGWMTGGGWDTHTVDLSYLAITPDTTILNVNLRFFFEASSNLGLSAYEGFIGVDNVTPIGGGPLTIWPR